MLTVTAHNPTQEVASQVVADEQQATELAAAWFLSGMTVHVTGGSTPCNACGECCRQGGHCDFRNMLGLPSDFTGTCEALREQADGSTTCRWLSQVAAAHPEHLPVLGIVGVCDFPHLRRELFPIERPNGHAIHGQCTTCKRFIGKIDADAGDGLCTLCRIDAERAAKGLEPFSHSPAQENSPPRKRPMEAFAYPCPRATGRVPARKLVQDAKDVASTTQAGT